MKIGLIDVDSHNFPNLALMKLSAYHKSRGDQVEMWNGLFKYDRVYQSKVFDDTYSSPTSCRSAIIINLIFEKERVIVFMYMYWTITRPLL